MNWTRRACDYVGVYTTSLHNGRRFVNNRQDDQASTKTNEIRNRNSLSVRSASARGIDGPFSHFSPVPDIAPGVDIELC